MEGMHLTKFSKFVSDEVYEKAFNLNDGSNLPSGDQILFKMGINLEERRMFIDVFSKILQSPQYSNLVNLVDNFVKTFFAIIKETIDMFEIVKKTPLSLQGMSKVYKYFSEHYIMKPNMYA